MSTSVPDDPYQTKSMIGEAAAKAVQTPAPELVMAPGRRLGSYELLAALGKGGMGMVFRARHLVLKKEFALKVLSPRLTCDEHAVQRFQRETEALGRLEDPHLVRASDAGVSDGVPYLVMELLDGVDLAKLTETRGSWPVAEACEAIRQAALGLQHAFERGLVHRDIKPSNLWLTRSGQVKVLDLGLARLCDEDGTGATMTAAGKWMGTPDYIAPEQILDSHTADIRADLYSLGCTLFTLLSGEPPFAASTHPTLRLKNEAHLNEPPPDIRKRRPDIPDGLVAVLGKLLAKRPEDRYQTPAQAAAALEPFAAGARLTALENSGAAPETPFATTRSDEAATTLRRKTSLPYARLKRILSQHRWLSTLVLLVGLFSVLSTMTLWYEIRAPHLPLPNEMTRDYAQKVVPAPPDKVRVMSLEVKHFATINGHSAPPRLLGKDVFMTRRDDSVTVEAKLSRPAYAFVIAFRPDGTTDVCFPEKEDEAPPLTDHPRYPSKSLGENYGLEEGTGLQVFALVVSSEPLPSFKEWWSRCRGCPWKKYDAVPGVVWRADGIDDAEALTAEDSGTRGKGKQVEGKTPMAQLARWLRQTPQVETVSVLGFAVMPKEKR